ncbi:MAG: cyclase [Acidimicrobiia bacterium]|nr:cyclase [Acidimicrobiia bacterium]
MSATLIVRHPVTDFDAWLAVYREVDALRTQHGCTAERVLQLPTDPNDVVAIHEFPTVAQAEAFASDPSLKAAMERSGVAGVPRIEIFASA